MKMNTVTKQPAAAAAAGGDDGDHFNHSVARVTVAR
jgi:hypothetical protein